MIESVLFSYLVNSMQNQAWSTSWALAINRSIVINLRLVDHPWYTMLEWNAVACSKTLALETCNGSV